MGVEIISLTTINNQTFCKLFSFIVFISKEGLSFHNRHHVIKLDLK